MDVGTDRRGDGGGSLDDAPLGGPVPGEAQLNPDCLELLAALLTSATCRPRPIPPPGVVYYIRKGPYVKIGYTSHLTARMATLRPDVLLATEPGSYELETQRRHEFAFALSHGRDWFHPAQSLLSHIADMAARPGGKPSWAPVPRGGTPETRRAAAAQRAAYRANSSALTVATQES